MKQGNRFVENNIVTQKLREKDYQQHQKKIMEIKKAQRPLVLQLSDREKQLKIQQCKVQTSFFQQNERLKQITKENKQLLDNLIHIGDGKRSQFRTIWGLVESTDQKKIMADTTIYKSSVQNKRLHSPLRRKEMERIQEENFQMAQRIISRGSNFDQSEQSRHQKKYQHLKDHMRKVKDKPMNSAIRLPPMDQSRIPNRSLSQEKSINTKDLGNAELRSYQQNADKLEKLIQSKKQKITQRLSQNQLSITNNIQSYRTENTFVPNQNNPRSPISEQQLEITYQETETNKQTLKLEQDNKQVEIRDISPIKIDDKIPDENKSHGNQSQLQENNNQIDISKSVNERDDHLKDQKPVEEPVDVQAEGMKDEIQSVEDGKLNALQIEGQEELEIQKDIHEQPE